MPKVKRDVERFNLMGPVRSITTERKSATGAWQIVGECVFDQAGNLVRRTPEGDTEDQHPDGTRTQVRHLPANFMWSLDGFDGMGFGTHGAVVARTTFSTGGDPVETLLLDDGGEVLSRLAYTCDGIGIRDAVQYMGDAAPAWAKDLPDVPEVRAMLVPGFEQARATFEYDESGRLARRRIWMVGQLVGDEHTTYNERGDPLPSDDTEVRYEYRDDDRGNWIQRTRHDAGGSAEERRTIGYFGE